MPVMQASLQGGLREVFPEGQGNGGRPSIPGTAPAAAARQARPCRRQSRRFCILASAAHTPLPHLSPWSSDPAIGPQVPFRHAHAPCAIHVSSCARKNCSSGSNAELQAYVAATLSKACWQALYAILLTILSYVDGKSQTAICAPLGMHIHLTIL